MRIELHGGPADGLRREAPDDTREVYLTDIGVSTEGGPDPFRGKSLGRMTYSITDQVTDDGRVIFKYAGSTGAAS